MKKSDDKLDRLFALARQAPPAPGEAAGAHWQSRVLAHWHPAGAHGELWSFLHATVRRGFLCAALLMFACIVWSLNAPDQDTDNDFDIASFELHVDGLQ